MSEKKQQSIYVVYILFTKMFYPLYLLNSTQTNQGNSSKNILNKSVCFDKKNNSHESLFRGLCLNDTGKLYISEKEMICLE